MTRRITLDERLCCPAHGFIVRHHDDGKTGHCFQCLRFLPTCDEIDRCENPECQ